MSGAKAQSAADLSRRVFLSGLPATPALEGVLKRAEGPTSGLCKIWLANSAEERRLSLQWGRHEAQLNVEHGWYRLSEAEQQAHPANAELRQMEVALNRLATSREALTARISGARAMTLDAVTLKLVVAAEVVSLDDHREGHHLIRSVLGDLLTLRA